MPERRQHGRRRVVLRGTLLPYDAPTVILCTIRNISAYGAYLRTAVRSSIPDTFDLLIEGEKGAVERKRCKVAWRNDNDVGVTFDGEAT